MPKDGEGSAVPGIPENFFIEIGEDGSLKQEGVMPLEGVITQDSLPRSIGGVVEPQTEGGYEELREVREREFALRQEKILNNRKELGWILIPEGKSIWHHATETGAGAQMILERGLFADGLGSTAKSLTQFRPTIDATPEEREAQKKAVEKTNLEQLVRAHRNRGYQVIIELPNLTEEQKMEYFKNKETVGYDEFLSELFLEDVREPIFNENGIPVGRILPAKYIKGYIDLGTGAFVARNESTEYKV